MDAIGYISLGSLSDSVKALEIDGAAATVENIKNGTYKVARPFNIVTGATVSESAQAFIDFILSAEGQRSLKKTNTSPALTMPPRLPEAPLQARSSWLAAPP